MDKVKNIFEKNLKYIINYYKIITLNKAELKFQKDNLGIEKAQKKFK